VRPTDRAKFDSFRQTDGRYRGTRDLWLEPGWAVFGAVAFPSFPTVVASRLPERTVAGPPFGSLATFRGPTENPWGRGHFRGADTPVTHLLGKHVRGVGRPSHINTDPA